MSRSASWKRLQTGVTYVGKRCKMSRFTTGDVKLRTRWHVGDDVTREALRNKMYDNQSQYLEVNNSISKEDPE